MTAPKSAGRMVFTTNLPAMYFLRSRIKAGFSQARFLETAAYCTVTVTFVDAVIFVFEESVPLTLNM